MKKLVLLILCAVMLAGCGSYSVKAETVNNNVEWFDTHYNFNMAQVKMPDGTVVKGKCDKWKDYSDCDMIQVVIDGKYYYTHSSNVVLYD